MVRGSPEVIHGFLFVGARVLVQVGAGEVEHVERSPLEEDEFGVRVPDPDRAVSESLPKRSAILWLPRLVRDQLPLVRPCSATPGASSASAAGRFQIFRRRCSCGAGGRSCWLALRSPYQLPPLRPFPFVASVARSRLQIFLALEGALILACLGVRYRGQALRVDRLAAYYAMGAGGRHNFPFLIITMLSCIG